MQRLTCLGARHTMGGSSSAPAASLSMARRLFSLVKKGSNMPIRDLPPVTYRMGVPQDGKLSQLKWKDRFVIYVVFALTGTTAVMIVKPTLAYLCEEGFWGLAPGDGFVKGPWTFRGLYFAIMWPTYTFLLLWWGAIFTRYRWFAHQAHKMWSRILPRFMSDWLKRVWICEEKQRSTLGWTTGYRPGSQEAAAAAAAAAVDAQAKEAARLATKRLEGAGVKAQAPSQ